MRCLSKTQCEQWLAKCNYGDLSQPAFAYEAQFTTPKDSGRKCALVKWIIDWLPRSGECLIAITGWGIWSSCENVQLFHLVREALGHSDPSLDNYPGQVIEYSDRRAIECILDLCLYNFWDATVADSGHRFLIQFSHDEDVFIACSSSLRKRVQAIYDEFGKESNLRIKKE